MHPNGGGGGGGGGRGPAYASGPGNLGHGDVPACQDLGTQVPPGIAYGPMEPRTQPPIESLIQRLKTGVVARTW